MRVSSFVITVAAIDVSSGFVHNLKSTSVSKSSLNLTPTSEYDRRSVLVAPLLLPFLSVPGVQAKEPNPDLPPDAIRSYLQYRFPLQLSADYYLFELREKLGDFDKWGEVNTMFVNNGGGRGTASVSRLEREFINPMRILVLSMPPDESENLRDAMNGFEKAMFKLSKLTRGVQRDLSVELPPSMLNDARGLWEEGRVAFNSFLTTLNGATELDELKLIASTKGDYPRSERKYVELKKRLRTCQNRGGPALSQAWGQLMISGYMQDSCGIPDLDAYLFQ